MQMKKNVTLEPSGKAEGSLSEEEFMSMLAPGTPISRDIFERGFYVTGTTIKYRTGFFDAIQLYDNFFLSFVLIAILSSACYHYLRNGMIGKASILLPILIALVLGRLHFAYIFAIRPRIELDTARRVIRAGTSETPFSIITSVWILKPDTKAHDRRPRNELTIMLHCPFENISFTVFLKRNGKWAKSICESLALMINKDMEIKYES